MKQQAITNLKDKDWVQSVAANIVKLIILPILLLYGNNALKDIAEAQKDISRNQDKLGERITALHIGQIEYRTAYTKDKELIIYRISNLEDKYDDLYSEIHPKLSAKADKRTNNSRVVK